MQPNTPKDALDHALSRLYQADVPESFETGWRAAVRREETMKPMKKTMFANWTKRLMPALAAIVLAAGGLWAGTLEENGELGLVNQDAVMMRSTSSAKYAGGASNSVMYSAAVEESASYDLAAADTGVVTYGSVIDTQRKLVRTADLTIRTTAFDAAAQGVQSRLAEMGGYVEHLYQYGESVRRLSLSMRVPAEKLDEFLSGMDGLGRVTDRSESTTDMTTQYADNQARLSTLYAKRDRLNELLLKAEDVADLIEIESAIADTQYAIDSYETSQRSIDRQVEMSAVNVTIMEETPADSANDAEKTLGERMSAALHASVEWLGEFLRDVLVFVVMIAPAAVPLAAIGFVLHLIRRWKRKKEETK